MCKDDVNTSVYSSDVTGWDVVKWPWGGYMVFDRSNYAVGRCVTLEDAKKYADNKIRGGAAYV